MSRQLLTDQNSRLETVTEHLDRGLELDETRNELLRDLLEETESGNFSQAKGGGLGGLGGVFAGLLGGVGLGGLIATRVADVLGDLDPAEAIGAVDLLPGDVLASGASVTASALIGNPADVTASDVIDAPVPLTATDLVAGGASVAAATLIDDPAVVDAIDVVDDPAGIEAYHLIRDKAGIDAPDVIDEPIDLAVADLVDVPEGGIDIKEVIAGALTAGAGAEAARQASQGSGPFGSAARVGSAVTAPFMIPSMLVAQSERRRDRGEGGLLERFLPDLPNFGGGQDRTRRASMGVTPTASSSDSISATNAARDRYDRRGGGTNVEVNVTADGPDQRELDRAMEQAKREAKREIAKQLGGGPGIR